MQTPIRTAACIQFSLLALIHAQVMHKNIKNDSCPVSRVVDVAEKARSANNSTLNRKGVNSKWISLKISNREMPMQTRPEKIHAAKAIMGGKTA